MRRPFVEFLAAELLDDVTEIHHQDSIAEVLDDLEIVGDEDQGQVELLLEFHHQVEDLGLDRDVECGDGLVGDQEFGPQSQGAGDADALTLATAEFVRELLACVIAEPDLGDQFVDEGGGALGRGHDLVEGDHLFEQLLDREPRVERRIGVLEDHLDASPERHELAVALAGQLLAVVVDLSLARWMQLNDALAEGRLAAARFADDAQDLALGDVEVHAIDGVDVCDDAIQHAATHGEALV
jgi:hypothetical protein